MFGRISGLKDPRVGRGLYNSYHAGNPLLRFPIDQVLMSPRAKIERLGRFRPVGSDHFAITATFHFNGVEKQSPSPQGNDLEQADEMIDEGKEDVRENEQKAKDTKPPADSTSLGVVALEAPLLGA